MVMPSWGMSRVRKVRMNCCRQCRLASSDALSVKVRRLREVARARDVDLHVLDTGHR
jgi:hypothetical protein